MTMNVFQLLKHYAVATAQIDQRVSLFIAIDDLSFDEKVVVSNADFLAARCAQATRSDLNRAFLCAPAIPTCNSVRGDEVEQMTTDQAREHAVDIFQAADRAEFDAAPGRRASTTPD